LIIEGVRWGLGTCGICIVWIFIEGRVSLIGTNGKICWLRMSGFGPMSSSLCSGSSGGVPTAWALV
jgi:hypothetical protein